MPQLDRGSRQEGQRTHLVIVGIVGGVVEGGGSKLMLGAGGDDAVAVGGRGSVADVLVGLGEMRGFHAAGTWARAGWQ